METTNHSLITGQDLADKLGCSYTSLMYRAKQGDIPSLKFNRNRLFDLEQFDHIKKIMDAVKPASIPKDETGQAILELLTNMERRMKRMECRLYDITDLLTKPKLADKFKVKQ